MGTWKAAEGATPGQNLTAVLRHYFSVGTRTRRHRRDRYGNMSDLHLDMVEAIIEGTQNRGLFTPNIEGALVPGYGAALSYEKHVQGYRIDCTLNRQINDMSPWRFAALLGQMVDAGITNTGEGERYFSEMARGMYAASAA
jgi:hypothetical protein